MRLTNDFDLDFFSPWLDVDKDGPFANTIVSPLNSQV